MKRRIKHQLPHIYLLASGLELSNNYALKTETQTQIQPSFLRHHTLTVITELHMHGESSMWEENCPSNFNDPGFPTGQDTVHQAPEKAHADLKKSE